MLLIITLSICVYSWWLWFILLCLFSVFRYLLFARYSLIDPVERPAEILYDAVPTAVVTLGEPTTLRCYAYGYPYPSVTWWKEERIIGLNQTDLYRRGFDHSLVITRVTLRALGPYTCQAYNGKGRAASWTLTLHAVGPTLPLSVEDQPYAIYLIQPPTSPIPTSLPSPPTSFPEPPSPTEHVEYTGNGGGICYLRLHCMWFAAFNH